MWLSIIIIALTISIVSFCLLIWLLAVRSQTPKRKPITDLSRVPFEKVQFPLGIPTNQGWFIPSCHTAKTSEPSPVIILVHGWQSNRSNILRYTQPLHEAGFSIFMYDTRNHGESASVKISSGLTFRDDLIAAIDYLYTRTDVSTAQIGVLSHSLGAYGTCLALTRDHRLAAVVTDSMPVDTKTMIAAELDRYKLPHFPLVIIIPFIWLLRIREKKKTFDIAQAVEQSATPILLIHSKQDNYIPSSELDNLLNRLKRPVEFLFVNSDGHRSSEQDEHFWQKVIPFFKQHLKIPDSR